MRYRVVYTESLIRDLDQHLAYLTAQQVGRQVIDRWFGRLHHAIDDLYLWPRGHRIDEIQARATGRETRKANVGDYLIFYLVNESAKTVVVTTFIHGAKRRKLDQ